MEKEPNREDFVLSKYTADKTGEQKSTSRVVWRILILGAVLIVLVVLSIGIVKLVPKALSSLASVNISFTSLFSPREKITVKSDKSQINSGDSFNVTWEHAGEKVDGYYNLSTACQDRYRIEYQLGKNRRVINCTNVIRLSASTTSFSLFGFNNGTDTVTVPVTLDFISLTDGKIQVSGETSVIINATTTLNNNTGQNATSSSAGNQSGGNQTYPPIQNSGIADLRVQIISVSNPNPIASERVTIVFVVENIGSGSSGPWDLRAVMPAVNINDQTKYLYNNASIPAGQAIRGQLYVEGLQTGNNRLIQLSIDPNNRLNELRKDNNVAEETINVSGSNSGSGGGITTNGIDLTIKILDVNPLSNSSAEVRFEVTNQGSQPSGSWDYRMEISDADLISNNNNQQSMAPGESRIFTARFNGLNRNDNNNLEITVDPRDRIDESRENNNDDSEDINL